MSEHPPDTVIELTDRLTEVLGPALEAGDWLTVLWATLNLSSSVVFLLRESAPGFVEDLAALEEDDGDPRRAAVRDAVKAMLHLADYAERLEAEDHHSPGDSSCHFCNGPMSCYCKKPDRYDEGDEQAPTAAGARAQAAEDADYRKE